MGWTNSVPIFHDDVTYILQLKIPHLTIPYIDDIPVKGPKLCYIQEDGSYETIPQNPEIRHFVWEHSINLNRIVQCMKYCRGTFSGKKLEEASWKAKEDQRIVREEAVATLLENSGRMSAKEFTSRIHGIEQEFGLVSVGEGGDNTMEVLDGENTGDKSQVFVNQGHPKPCPLTKPRPITFKLVDTDKDDDNESKDSDIAEVQTIPSKTGSKLSGRSKHKRSLGEVEVMREGGQVRKVCHNMSCKVTLY